MNFNVMCSSLSSIKEQTMTCMQAVEGATDQTSLVNRRASHVLGSTLKALISSPRRRVLKVFEKLCPDT